MSEGQESTTDLQWLLGAGCGALIANLYYAQPLTGLISASLGILPQHAGLIMTLALDMKAENGSPYILPFTASAGSAEALISIERARRVDGGTERDAIAY